MVDPRNHEALVWVPFGVRAGAWRNAQGEGFPVTNGVMRLDAAAVEHAWVLRELGLRPARGDATQSAESVASFGFQWSWDHTPRTEEDLRWRAQERFELQDGFFAGKRLLDAGCGAGAQAAFFAQRGASVTAADLSSAIEVAAARPELREATLIQGDLAHLPLATGSMDVVYCEGVLQHTSELQPVLAELARVLAPGGLLLATHYLKPSGPAKRLQWLLRQGIRAATRGLPQEVVFLGSGIAASMSMLPVVGPVIGQTIAVRNPRMPTLKATWSATYDTYGLHHFQRYLAPEAFRESVERTGFHCQSLGEPGVVKATRL